MILASVLASTDTQHEVNGLTLVRVFFRVLYPTGYFLEWNLGQELVEFRDVWALDGRIADLLSGPVMVRRYSSGICDTSFAYHVIA